MVNTSEESGKKAVHMISLDSVGCICTWSYFDVLCICACMLLCAFPGGTGTSICPPLIGYWQYCKEMRLPSSSLESRQVYWGYLHQHGDSEAATSPRSPPRMGGNSQTYISDSPCAACRQLQLERVPLQVRLVGFINLGESFWHRS